MSKAASHAKLSGLHAKFAEYLEHILDDAMKPVEYDEDGNIVGGGIPLDAATMGVILKMLKDNEITCEPADLETLEDLREKYGRQSKERSVSQILEDAKASEQLLN